MWYTIQKVWKAIQWKLISLPPWPSVTHFLNLYHCRDILWCQRVWMAAWYERDTLLRILYGRLTGVHGTIIGPNFQVRRPACDLKRTGHWPKNLMVIRDIKSKLLEPIPHQSPNTQIYTEPWTKVTSYYVVPSALNTLPPTFSIPSLS